MFEKRTCSGFCEKDNTRSPVTAVDAVAVANVLGSPQVQLFRQAEVWCIALCCEARRCSSGECGAECVGACANSDLVVEFSTQAVEYDVSFAKLVLCVNVICGY